MRDVRAREVLVKKFPHLTSMALPSSPLLSPATTNPSSRPSINSPLLAKHLAPAAARLQPLLFDPSARGPPAALGVTTAAWFLSLWYVWGAGRI